MFKRRSKIEIRHRAPTGVVAEDTRRALRQNTGSTRFEVRLVRTGRLANSVIELPGRDWEVVSAVSKRDVHGNDAGIDLIAVRRVRAVEQP